MTGRQAPGWRGKRVSDMTEAEIRDMAGAAPGVVRIRISGDGADADKVALMLWAATGLEVLEQSAPYANRREPGVRIYLTARTASDHDGREATS